ncbi:lytic transglycosylase domain-containing protein [Acidiphilium sp. AL]|uniref:Lytic transglycosylase domain-containing protein n=1 Tax=Acidiphilium iwatense TaxID=768198 RepID=A0ABS9DTW8_9PROT|nr:MULTISPECIES: lytic transglycosylase domain-containing protein [Acidiphilium]MCF3946132.1 lytic transglycosylase domain-containing protein [Acidiphilium iwatense]MCU4161002.1 lytic transglycosylase domain-containing protein [Acidiphilium sp. AL]
MSRKGFRGLALLTVLWLMSGGAAMALPSGIVPALAPVTDPSALCAAAIGMAQRIANTPAGLLNAIATVESGRRDPETDRLEPWPWTIDADGNGHFYPTEAAAIAAASAFQRQGVASIDLGCMQINLQHHPGAFATLAQALDPAANALYGAQFLRRLKSRLGGWPPAIAAYHSETPALGQPYEQKVLAAWQGSASAPSLIPAVSAIPKPVVVPDTVGKSPPPGAIALRHYGAGGFQFSALHGHGQIIPIAMPSSRAAPIGGIGARGLAAYRAAPIPITGAK